jgi:flagellar basal-body rod protein FlgB
MEPSNVPKNAGTTVGRTAMAETRKCGWITPHICRLEIKGFSIIAAHPPSGPAGPGLEPQRIAMFANLTSALDFQSKALVLRAERQQVIASNIANADTPGYSGRDFDFKQAMQQAIGESSLTLPMRSSSATAGSDGTTNTRHIPLPGIEDSQLGKDHALGYTVQTQPAMDGNSVDLDHERANFVDNSVRYEATLRFINGSSRTILSAIQGQ